MVPAAAAALPLQVCVFATPKTPVDSSPSLHPLLLQGQTVSRQHYAPLLVLLAGLG